VDVLVKEAALGVLVVSIFVNAVDRDQEGAQGLRGTGREGREGGDDSPSLGCRAIDGRRADRHTFDILGCIRNSFKLLVISRCVDEHPAVLDLEADLVVPHGLQGHYSRAPVARFASRVGVDIAPDIVEVR
jgi:hypothetical protein